VRHFYYYYLRASVCLRKVGLRLIGLTVTGIGYWLIYCYILRVILITALFFQTRERLVSSSPKPGSCCARNYRPTLSLLYGETFYGIGQQKVIARKVWHGHFLNQHHFYVYFENRSHGFELVMSTFIVY
jgi:hypothetical protein